MTLRIDGPDGVIIEQTDLLEKGQAQLFRATGKRMRGTGLPAGTYSATATLSRAGEVIDRETRQMIVE
jgi:hypothetical protein